MNGKSTVALFTGFILILSFLGGCTTAPNVPTSQPVIIPPNEDTSANPQPAPVGTGWTIGLDPGHGWQGDPGAVGNGLEERAVTLDIALRTKAILESNGFRVVLTRTGDDSHSLAQAAKVINTANPDLVVSIHANSFNSTSAGTEACYTAGKNTDAESKALAKLLTDSVAAKLSMINRGIFPENSTSRCARTASTGWTQLHIHNMNPPTALIETAFISNPQEAALLRDRAEDFAQAIADAIISYIQNTNATPPAVVAASSNNSGAAAITSASTSTVLVIDTSGSMSEQDPTGKLKVEAARAASVNVLDVISAENQASGSDNQKIGIVDFNAFATIDAPLSADVAVSKSALQSLYPSGGTGMPLGLQTALGMFGGAGSDKSIVILLSDGMPNIGLNGESDETVVRQQVLDLASQAKGKGICIYTVGLGDPALGNSSDAGLDEAFLTQVAESSGCGSYQNARDAWQLANVYIGLRHTSTGNTLMQKSGQIAQGETVSIGTVQVPDDQSMILFTLNWPGSQLDAVLTDPTGMVVDARYAQASLSTADTLASIIIQDPQPGEWKITIQGVDVPEGITTYNAVLSVRPSPIGQPAAAVTPITPGFPMLILFLVLAGGSITTYVMVRTRARSNFRTRMSTASAQLICVRGELAGQAIPLSDGVRIGRGSSGTLKLSERTVSRQHAVFRFTNGQWFVQDLNSHTGTFVNEASVQAIALKSGDRIRIGSSEFEFRTLR